NAATDIEYKFPFGFKEVEGIHSRTDFDLSRHQEFSGRKMQYFDSETSESYVPYVVETSIGVDRMVLQILSASYTEEDLTKEGGAKDERVVLKFPPALAPIKVAILPLTKKDGLPELAKEIVEDLKFDYTYQYDEKDSIGKRYRRQDAIGTPLCITIDHQSLEDKMVTIRHRDDMTQERVAIADLPQIIEKTVSMRKLLKSLM
ncbi:MAG: His/Gly/Thr/Pro-type tRNA ligase C-terminal domain-containing protein, partial [Rikenellaceae bacterium]